MADWFCGDAAPGAVRLCLTEQSATRNAARLSLAARMGGGETERHSLSAPDAAKPPLT